MTNEEMTKLAEMTARRTATIVIKQLSEMHVDESNDLIDSKEAARLLGLTPNYLRSMKDKFPHVKVGDNRQGRILFKRSELLANYTK
jgi:hypothetical protein